MEFNHGDVVRVVRKVKTYTEGWKNSWEGPMTAFINNKKEYTIRARDRSGMGYSFEEDRTFLWPAAALELVITNSSKTPVERRIRKLWNESKWVKLHPTQAY